MIIIFNYFEWDDGWRDDALQFPDFGSLGAQGLLQTRQHNAFLNQVQEIQQQQHQEISKGNVPQTGRVGSGILFVSNQIVC